MAEKKQEEIYKERFLNRDSRWMHMPGQSTGAYTNATHGMTLSAVALPHYRYIMPYGLKNFKRFAEKVWNVCPDGKKR